MATPELVVSESKLAEKMHCSILSRYIDLGHCYSLRQMPEKKTTCTGINCVGLNWFKGVPPAGALVEKPISRVEEDGNGGDSSNASSIWLASKPEHIVEPPVTLPTIKFTVPPRNMELDRLLDEIERKANKKEKGSLKVQGKIRDHSSVNPTGNTVPVVTKTKPAGERQQPKIAPVKKSPTQSTSSESVSQKTATGTVMVKGKETEAVKVSPEMIEQIVLIKWAEIRPFAKQPRKHFNRARLDKLKDAIKAKGQKTPVQLRVINDPDYKYELVTGERRWTVCGELGLEYIRAIIVPIADEKEQFVESVIENICREDLCELDNIETVKRLHDYGCSLKEIVDITGQEMIWVNQHLLALRCVPKVLAMLSPDLPIDKQLSFTAVYALSMLPDKNKQLEFAQKAIKLKWSVAKLRREIESQGVVVRRRRSPSDDYEVYATFIAKTAKYLEDLIINYPGLTGRMFERRSSSERQNNCERINMIIVHFQQLKGKILKMS